MVTRISSALVITLLLYGNVGCSTTKPKVPKAEQGAKIEQMEPITSGGSGQAVLSLHRKLAFKNGCKLGLTLTNNLSYAITNIAFRFTAHAKNSAPHHGILRNFFEINPAQSQYREVFFKGITCDQISYIEITDPGRCALGKLTRLSSKPGDCIRLVHVAKTPYVKLVQSQRKRLDVSEAH